MIQLTLVSRIYCHLCELMQEALLALPDLPAFALRVVDVDADATLLDRYDELVPVLLDQAGQELCHYHLDATKVREYLGGFE